MKVGFIGLGIMGSPMAQNLQKAGYDLVVYNRTPEKADDLVARGAQFADSPAEVGDRVDMLFTMLAAPKAVYETALGSHGFLDSLKENSLWVDCSTVNPSFSMEMAGKAREKGVRFLDAPVAGTKGPAEEGQLIFFVGGDEKDLDLCKPLLETMGRAVVHVGKNGMGTSMKMVVNLMLAESMLAFSEAMTLGEALGISKDALFNTLLGGPLTAPFIGGKRNKIETGNFEPEFPLKWMHKDTHLVSVTAYENDVALPALNVVKEIYAVARRNGLGDKDFSAIYHLLSSRFELK
jgi:3-hydroxyisobutyrate dehydrogenase-like beta-hydroxyacid dehydrogenase